MDTKPFAVNLPLELIERIKREARQRSIKVRRRVPICEVVRNALEDACVKEETRA